MWSCDDGDTDDPKNKKTVKPTCTKDVRKRLHEYPRGRKDRGRLSKNGLSFWGSQMHSSGGSDSV